MAIDPTAVGATGGPAERSWTSKDGLLYALGVGAGIDELQFTTEKKQQVLPTMAVVLGRRARCRCRASASSTRRCWCTASRRSSSRGRSRWKAR